MCYLLNYIIGSSRTVFVEYLKSVFHTSIPFRKSLATEKESRHAVICHAGIDLMLTLQLVVEHLHPKLLVTVVVFL